ncbi:MAG: serine hydrolase [Prevotella sp.]|nr:serine hydrolase [Alistipes senegalensis]MCM1357523.1 serine hydrolase [Prevotella sp.]MCM1472464.1 serine hydrolase [Muribaculaceae bacterium]MDE6424651.1 serine hydrolase [Ruminococcus sp.]
MKKFLSALTAIFMTLPFLCVPKANAINFTLKTTLQSESVVLLNLDTKTIINEKNADVRQMPGPLVNIMTAVVVLENCQNINQEIIMDENVYNSIYETEYPDDVRTADIYNEDRFTVTDLLYAMMLTSSMEAAQTLAYYVGGSDVNNFVHLMNQKAEALGLENTHFTNPTGLYDENQYTSARDMAKLTQYALNVSIFEQIATTYTYKPTVPNNVNHEDFNEWYWTHSNEMMNPESANYYNAAKGIKTANLQEYGRNIITIASKDGNNYLAVLLKSPMTDEWGNQIYSHIEDAITIFDWAFTHISYQVLLADTAEVGELPVELAAGNDYVLARPKEEVTMLWYDEIDVAVVNKYDVKWYSKFLYAPVKKGDPLGEVTLKYNGEELGTVELVAVSDVERSTSKYNLYAVKQFVGSKWFRNALMVSILLCVIYIIVCIYCYILYRNRKKEDDARRRAAQRRMNNPEE